MSNAPHVIELPEDRQAFAEERVRTVQHASVTDVVREALEKERLPVLRAAIDEGDAGLGIEPTVDEFMAEVMAAAGLER